MNSVWSDNSYLKYQRLLSGCTNFKVYNYIFNYLTISALFHFANLEYFCFLYRGRSSHKLHWSTTWRLLFWSWNVRRHLSDKNLDETSSGQHIVPQTTWNTRPLSMVSYETLTVGKWLRMSSSTSCLVPKTIIKIS